MTAASRAASKLGRLSYEKRLQTEGYAAIRARCVKNTKRFRFKKRRGKKPPAPTLSKPLAAPAVAASSIAKAAPIPEQRRDVPLPVPSQPTEEKLAQPVAPQITLDDAAYLKSIIEARMQMRIEEGERQAAQERKQLWDEKFYSRD